MKTKLLGLFAAGLLAGPMAANAAIVWDWSFAGETGTFTTTGTSAGGAAAAGTYDLTDFSVNASTAGGTVGSISGGQYFTGPFLTTAPYTLDWDGSAVTKFDHSGTNSFNWWTFGPGSSAYTYFFGWGSGNINDVTQAAFYTGNISQPSYTVSVRVQNAAVPEPAMLSLLGLGLAGIGLIRRRKAN